MQWKRSNILPLIARYPKPYRFDRIAFIDDYSETVPEIVLTDKIRCHFELFNRYSQLSNTIPMHRYEFYSPFCFGLPYTTFV